MPQSCRSTSAISPSSRKLLANSSWLGTLGRRMSSIGWQNGQWPRSCSRAAAMNTSASSGRTAAREPLVVGQLLQIQQRQPIHAQAVLEARVDGRRIDQRHQAQLADARQAAEIGRVDQLPHAGRQRHVDLGRNAHQAPAGVQGDDFGNVENGCRPNDWFPSPCWTPFYQNRETYSTGTTMGKLFLLVHNRFFDFHDSNNIRLSPWERF